MTVDDTLNRTNLTSKTVAQLREICREKSLLISGKKAELVERILESIDIKEKVEDSEALILDDEIEEKNQNKEKNNLGQYEIGGIAPSQYVKTEIDYIKHWQIKKNNILAIRFFSGIAIPFGNANNIPFSRSYFSGGANDNRAWRAYSLGPGISKNINEFNEANFKLSLNFEYRFKILGKMNGALFVDGGNIWNVLDNIEDENSRFNSFKDLREIAIGSGFGLRYDFDFFVFRFDTGFKTYNPSLENKDRWWSEYALNRAVFNIGINYPF